MPKYRCLNNKCDKIFDEDDLLIEREEGNSEECPHCGGAVLPWVEGGYICCSCEKTMKKEELKTLKYTVTVIYKCPVCKSHVREVD